MKKPKIPVQKLKEFEIGLVYLFGSQALDTEIPLSDIDVGIVFSNPHVLRNPKQLQKNYSELYDIFAETYSPTFKKELDIVFLQQTGISFQFNVITEGRMLYEATSEFRANYEGKVINEYLDFEPVIRYFNQVFLERLG